MSDARGSEVDALLAALRDEDPAVRERASAALWDRWFAEKGTKARRLLEYGTTLLGVERYAEALAVFERLAEAHPDFAEAHNKRATTLYLMRRFDEASEACHQTLRLNPIHFGAWHGLGLCEMEMGRFVAAQKAFARALEIQPHAEQNRTLLEHCRDQVN
jgi:Flp pilus assembly protein TadD